MTSGLCCWMKAATSFARASGKPSKCSTFQLRTVNAMASPFFSRRTRPASSRPQWYAGTGRIHNGSVPMGDAGPQNSQRRVPRIWHLGIPCLFHPLLGPATGRFPCGVLRLRLRVTAWLDRSGQGWEERGGIFFNDFHLPAFQEFLPHLVVKTHDIASALHVSTLSSQLIE